MNGAERDVDSKEADIEVLFDHDLWCSEAVVAEGVMIEKLLTSLALVSAVSYELLLFNMAYVVLLQSCTVEDQSKLRT